ncbi:MAG: hypothetical protein HYZ53_18805 [Planctomycetes bacterium]|nr:hypothetical protein [Planctomycetota bacterium]
MMSRKQIEMGLCLIAAGVAAFSMLRGPATDSTLVAGGDRNGRTITRTTRAARSVGTVTARQVEVELEQPLSPVVAATTSAPSNVGTAVPMFGAPMAADGAQDDETRLADAVEEMSSLFDHGAEMRFALRLRADQDLASGLRSVAEGWMGSDDGKVRARGFLVVAMLDRRAGVAQWHTAVLGDRDAGVRAILLRHAPLTGTRTEDVEVIETLLAAVEHDADADTRRAALRGLATDLSPAEHDRLAQAASTETDPETRTALLCEVAHHGNATPAVLGLLGRSAFGPTESELTHSIAIEGLVRLETARPGTLDADVLTRLSVIAQAEAAAQASDEALES